MITLHVNNLNSDMSLGYLFLTACVCHLVSYLSKGNKEVRKESMATKTNRKKPEKKVQQLVNEVFSWSHSDVLNRNLYKGKVAEIPKTFPSVSDYTKSFVFPLFEETHADLLSRILQVNRSPTAEIVKVQKSKGFKLPKVLVYTIFLKRRQGFYEPEGGDLIALTDIKPKSADDLKMPNKSYLLAFVHGMEMNKSLYKLYIIASKPINQPENEDGIEKDLRSDASGKDVKHFAVFLTNLTTNIRISKALHSELQQETLKMMKNVLRVDFSVEEQCVKCSSDTTKDVTLVKMKEALTSFQLDSSQETAVLSCIAARGCRHQNTLKLIWGPPGTGKTKTVASLIFILLKMKCRTLTCAPTNIAVVGVTKRVMSLVRDSLLYDTYGLGDVVLFGNKERMKIDECEDLQDIFLNNRVKILADCLAPCSGWKWSSECMICFLEDPEDMYRVYMKEDLKDDGESNDIDDDDDDDDDQKDDESNEEENEDNLFFEKEDFDDLQVKGAKKKNWKTFIASTLEGEKNLTNSETTIKVANELPSKLKSDEKENILTFEQFVTKGFDYHGNELISCIENLYTHMPTSFISAEVAKQMLGLVRSLELFGELLKQTVASNVGLREALIGSEDAKTGGVSKLYACRMSSLEILKNLQKTLCFPHFKEHYQIRRFCLQNACLIFCTASNSVSLHTMNKIEFVVIDEAAQLKECESLIPLQLSGLRHAILVGDERQLPAMVQSKISEEAEFGRSLFERLASLGHKKHLLNVQYRMHPSISQFPNQEFYEKQILDGENVKSSAYVKHFLPGSMYGSYSFINVTSAKEEFDESQSRKNLMEVTIAAEIIATLFKESVARKRRVSVGCISPYNAQVNAIQKKLGNKYKGYEKYFSVNVRSVDGFQGSEEDVIIISTVRSNARGSVGFLSNFQRTNVALTRASGSIWKQLVVDAKVRGCFYDASEDKNLAQVAMGALVELGQLDSLFNMDSLLFNGAKWQVKFSDTFLETISRITDLEICKEVLSLLVKLSSGWRKDGNTKLNLEGICPLLEVYNVTQHLCLIWAVDLVAQNSCCIQELKIWDVLPAPKIEERAKMLMEKVYGNYTINMMNRCKEKCVDGNLMLPVTWPMSSDDTYPSWSLASQLAALSLRNQSASSSRASSVGGFGNQKSNKYGDSRSHGRGRGSRR